MLLKKPSAALTSTKKIHIDYQFCECLFILGAASEFALESRKKYEKFGHLIHQQEDFLMSPVLS